MKSSLTVIKPIKQRSKSAFTNNIFQQSDNFQEAPVAHKEGQQFYDYVGPSQFRKKLITKFSKPSQSKSKEIEAKAEDFQMNQMNQTSNSKQFFNSTINRNTFMSNLLKEQQVQATKQSRNLQKYKEYQNGWQRKKQLIRAETKKKSPILMDNNIKSLYVHPNQDKTDVINTFIVHYWEMSLRNHHPILQRHIKGHNFQKIQKEKLLQLREGIRKIENSIPILPIERLNRLKGKDLSLSGRNKIKKETENSSQFTTTRYSVPGSARLSQQQVFRINYEGDKKWLGSQNL